MDSNSSNDCLNDNLQFGGSPEIPIAKSITFSSNSIQNLSLDLPDSIQELSLVLPDNIPLLPSEISPKKQECTNSASKKNSMVNSLATKCYPKPCLKHRVRRKHTCPFCDLECGNFARHLERNHEDEASVQEFLCLDKNSIKRKKLIDKIRREGDFCTSSAIPVMRQDKPLTEFTVCKFCRGYYSNKSLRRHTKHCYFNPDPSKRFNAQVEGQTVMAGHFGPNDILRVSGVLNMMRADNVSMVIKKDSIICEVGRRYIRRHKDKHLLLVAKRNMRRLARLLIFFKTIIRQQHVKIN